MASEFKGIIKRQVRVYGVPKPVILTISKDGIDASLPGMRKKVSAAWDHVVRNLITPADCPSFVAGKPIEFLKQQAAKIAVKEEKLRRVSSD